MVERKDGGLTYSMPLTVYLRHRKGSEPPHEALVNLRDDAFHSFTKKWGRFLPEGAYDALSGSDLADVSLITGYRDLLRKAWNEDKAALKAVRDDLYHAFVNIRINERIELEIADLRNEICLLFLQDHLAGKTGFCGNPKCENPYFIKKKVTQKFCDVRACVTYAQRQYALRWWNAEGKKQREQRRKKAQRRKR
jgi:hypothetical protein